MTSSGDATQHLLAAEIHFDKGWAQRDAEMMKKGLHDDAVMHAGTHGAYKARWDGIQVGDEGVCLGRPWSWAAWRPLPQKTRRRVPALT
jgi:hypothetical protein